VGRLRACRRSGASLSCFPYPSSRGPLRCHSSRTKGTGAPGFDGVENQVFRRVLTMTPSPWMIRRTGRHRFGNELARTPVANLRRRRSPRLQTRFTLFAPHAANRSPTQGPPGEPPQVCEVTTVWRGRSDLVIDTIVHGRADQVSRRRHREYARGRAVFPRRRTGAKSQSHRRRFAKVRSAPMLRTC